MLTGLLRRDCFLTDLAVCQNDGGYRWENTGLVSWTFWCTVHCGAYRRGQVGTGCVQGTMGPQECCHILKIIFFLAKFVSVQMVIRAFLEITKKKFMHMTLQKHIALCVKKGCHDVCLF